METEQSQTDRLAEMFRLQEEFMRALQKKCPHDLPAAWPIDASDKTSQRVCRDIIHRANEELYEVLKNFKNWKLHRPGDTDVSMDDVLEESIDVMKYLFEYLILVGFSADDVYKMFVKKDEIIHKRLEENK